MIDELRALFAKLYAAGCEHDNYAYALSDELNAEVDKAMLEGFKTDLKNLAARCMLVSKTEAHALDHMKGHMPARHFSWRKFRRVPNAAWEAIDKVLQGGEAFFAEGAAAQTAQIEMAIRTAQGGEREEPEGETLGEEAAEPAETPQDAPQEAKPEEPTEAAGKPENGNESAAELWDEEEAEEDAEAAGDAE